MIKTIVQTLSVVANLCCLRGSPQALPYSLEMLFIFILAELGLTINSLSQFPLPGVQMWQIVLSTVLSMVVYVAIIYALLAQKKWQNRYVQVLIALFGTELVIELILKLIDAAMTKTSGDMSYFQVGVSLFFITWKILIVAYILRLALELKKVTSVLITFCIMIASSLPMNLIFSQYYQESQARNQEIKEAE